MTSGLDLPAFKADSVELCYREGDSREPQAWLVPMWCFADTTSFLRCDGSALLPSVCSYLVRLTVPNR